MKVPKIIAVVLMFALLLGTTSFASELNEENEYGEPNLSRWVYTSSTSQNLTISSSGTATMTSNVTGYSDKATKIVVYMYLQQYSSGAWRNVVTYRDEKASWYSDVQHTYSTLAKGYNYRLRCIYYVYGPDAYHYDYYTLYTAEKSY